jgi:hypothetical protein
MAGNVLNKIKKSEEIPSENIQIIFHDDELLEAEVNSMDDDSQTYLVSSNDDLWRCDCWDFRHNHGRNKFGGSYLCKHCLAVLKEVL